MKHSSMRAKNCWLALMIGAFAACLPQQGHSVPAPTPKRTSKPSPEFTARLNNLNRQKDWSHALWTEDNRPYAKIRNEIETRLRQGEKPSDLEKRYQIQRQGKYDAQKVFRWAYARYKAYLDTDKSNPNYFMDVASQMRRNLRPGAYDWVRLQYLIDASSAEKMVDLGRRLLHRKPEDAEVRARYEQFRVETILNTSIPKRIATIQKELKQNPKSFVWRRRLAFTYATAGGKTPAEERNNWRLADAEYRKILQLLPPNDPRRKPIIESIIFNQLKYDKQGRQQTRTPAMIKEALKTTKLR